MLEEIFDNKFTYQKLTEEEQTKRGILGRLVGVIADTKNPTRNGRMYNAQLWENVFNDPIVEEKITNRCCFGECGHPTDREEVDMEKIAICLAEKPKVGKDGLLYGVFDILATPCGKILKTLADYGCNIGISSRGSGDVSDDNEVDPDTYYFECFDAVIVPAVKTARTKYVTESLDKNAKTLKKALTESVKTEAIENRGVMKKLLEELEIEIEEDLTEDNVADKIQFSTDPDGDSLLPDNGLNEDVEETDADIEVDAIEEPTEEAEEVEDEIVDQDEVEETDEVDDTEIMTVKNFIDEFTSYDEDTEIVFNNIVIDDKEYVVNGLGLDDSDGKLTINLECATADTDNNEEEDETAEEINKEEIVPAEEISDEDSDETEETEEEAADDGTDEVIESLKDAIREKDALIQEVQELKKAKAVSDAEVEKLTEDLVKYKDAFGRTSELAAQGRHATDELNKSVESLTEQLAQKNAQVLKLTESLNKARQLTESNNVDKAKVEKLTESYNSMKLEKKNAETQCENYKKKCNEAVELAKGYKQKLATVLNHYIDTKAKALGVTVSEITSRLSESYSLKDIDAVCDSILDRGGNKLPFGNFRTTPRVQITESANQTAKLNDGVGYQIDDSLFELAGIDKKKFKF